MFLDPMYLVAVNLDNPREIAVAQAREGRTVRLGRKPESFPEEPVDLLRITWNDRLVSRNHCEAVREGDQLNISRLPALPGRSNPNALYSNEPLAKREVLGEPIEMNAGDSAIIGNKGITAIYWLHALSDLDAQLERVHQAREEQAAEFEEAPIVGQDYDELEQLDEYSLRLQLKLLQRELPEQVLSGWTDETDLFLRASVFLENALPGQKGVSAVFVALSRESTAIRYEVLNPDPLARADFRPSRTLLSRVNLEEADPSDIQIWSSKEHKRAFSAESLGDQVDWVCIVPVASMDESATVYRYQGKDPVYLYVETRQASETSATAFIPFLRLINSLVASLLSSRADQKLQDQMATYFSPGLRKLMQRLDQSILEPAMVDCSIMFADRRGHSRVLELARSDDEILARLDENQEVVGLITEEIFNSRGVVTDFAGDGALGLWGWPNIEEEATTHALEAVEAAEAIMEKLSDRVEFEEEQNRNMAAVRIGISSGRIAVGKTGPSQQWHISVFGSVANLGARLERIAKEFRIPILVSDETYLRIKGTGNRRFRRLCRIRPVGFEESYSIHELILPKSQGGSEFPEENVKTYESALELFHERKWNEALELLTSLPEDDPPTAWLMDNAVKFRENPPPPDWEGEIQSFSK
ncbi:MAG: adenylate/guanylate cyclase domain-containing protein [Verrucomicrobiota bacterium]